MDRTFLVGVAHDYLTGDHGPDLAEIGLEALDRTPGVGWEAVPTDGVRLPPEVIARYDGLIVSDQQITGATVAQPGRLVVIARFGVGYDSVDVAACTAAGIAVTITPDGVRRPVAAAALTLMLAATHRLHEKDTLVRSGRWHERLQHRGVGLTGKVLGVVGWGNVGQELCRLSEPLGLRQLAADPYADPVAASASGVELVGLAELLERSDVVVLTCALTPGTRKMIDAAALGRMKPTAFLVNIARGAVVDQAALAAALASGRIAGAALDVFDPEPMDTDDPLLSLDNVLLSPHATTWTDELVRNNGRSAVRALLDVAAGRPPAFPVDPAALQHPRLVARLFVTSSSSHQ